ncbi:chorismate mutase / prephenate dehydrogenase [Cyclonatronum proteinivorum]|uniref:chorismate mutase n=1 Tax=Cyclonatronum proteinivorum TaxID=1457365 RepID=A0A345UPV5_9BACT|nr:bifunctional chorismate mutase/prephenate dehydrogenase [Cyclonatronum proteinivorum]AXJ02507.1 chorismate mutase / prephenate dehydrogenase [Cyclonatronum proteinivorum]
MSTSLEELRKRLDTIDESVLRLLAERQDIIRQVAETKRKTGVPVYVAGREQEKTDRFREQAAQLGISPDWAEDFLRMMMSASRANQSEATFPSATPEPKTWLIVGGEGGMGRLYAELIRKSGHQVRTLDRNDWLKARALTEGADVVLVTVPINLTGDVITRIARFMSPEQLLCDFTSIKAEYVNLMLQAHDGPVVGLHPMHGPDVRQVSRQLMVVCEGRQPEAAEWLIRQFELWGMRIKRADADMHDRAMHLVQGLRHFVALLHASFMNRLDLRPEDMLDYSSPIYRAELMMTGRIFAQDARLYADIVFSDAERIRMLTDFLGHHTALAEMVRTGDKERFIREFETATDFFGAFGAQALKESGYLINRLADRFG